MICSKHEGIHIIPCIINCLVDMWSSWHWCWVGILLMISLGEWEGIDLTWNMDSSFSFKSYTLPLCFVVYINCLRLWAIHYHGLQKCWVFGVWILGSKPILMSLFLITTKKKAFYRQPKSVANAQNPSVIQFFWRIFDGQKSVGKVVVGKLNRRKFLICW